MAWLFCLWVCVLVSLFMHVLATTANEPLAGVPTEFKLRPNYPNPFSDRTTLAFDAVGRLVGVSGCNDYSADYTARGSELFFTGIAATERSCADPPGVMAFEAGYLASLPRVASFSTSLTELTLRDSDGETVAEYRFGGRTR